MLIHGQLQSHQAYQSVENAEIEYAGMHLIDRRLPLNSANCLHGCTEGAEGVTRTEGAESVTRTEGAERVTRTETF